MKRSPAHVRSDSDGKAIVPDNLRPVRDNGSRSTRPYVVCLPKIDRSLFVRTIAVVLDVRTSPRIDRTRRTGPIPVRPIDHDLHSNVAVMPENFLDIIVAIVGTQRDGSPVIYRHAWGSGGGEREEKRGRRSTTKPDGRINSDNFRGSLLRRS